MSTSPTTGERHLELETLEFERDEGPRLARFVSELRAQVAGGWRLVLHDCPQMLAHTLYKADLLSDGRIVLASVRDEEPYG